MIQILIWIVTEILDRDPGSITGNTKYSNFVSSPIILWVLVMLDNGIVQIRYSNIDIVTAVLGVWHMIALLLALSLSDSVNNSDTS